MKVGHICTTLEGGAGLCAARIIKATRNLNVEAKVLVARGNKSKDEDVVEFVSPWSKNSAVRLFQRFLARLGVMPQVEKIKRRLAKESSKYQGTMCFTSPVTTYTHLADHPWIKEADIVHLHWIGNFVDYESFFPKIDKPIVWTIHYQNPGLGGFHLTSWKDKASESFKKLDDDLMKVKQRAYNKALNMTLVAISSQMCDYFKNNTLLKDFPIVKIHNGIERDSFVMLDKQKCREILSIPEKAKVFVFVSYDIHDDNKGLNKLIEALEIMHIPETILLCMGNYKKTVNASFKICCEGFVSNNRLQSIYYSAADFLVMPSLQETFAQSPMEAMACGTPVIAFPCSGTRDLINDKNGVVCDDFTIDALRKGISTAMIRNYNRDVIRQDLLERFSYNIIAKHYFKLYESVLSKYYHNKTRKN